MNTIRKELVVKIKILSVDDMWYERDIKMGWECKHENFSKCGEPSGLWLRREHRLTRKEIEQRLKKVDSSTADVIRELFARVDETQVVIQKIIKIETRSAWVVNTALFILVVLHVIGFVMG